MYKMTLSHNNSRVKKIWTKKTSTVYSSIDSLLVQMLTIFNMMETSIESTLYALLMNYIVFFYIIANISAQIALIAPI